MVDLIPTAAIRPQGPPKRRVLSFRAHMLEWWYQIFAAWQAAIVQGQPLHDLHNPRTHNRIYVLCPVCLPAANSDRGQAWTAACTSS